MSNYFKEAIVNSLLILKKYALLSILLSISVYSQNLSKINYIVTPTGGTFENNEDIKKFKTASRYIGIDQALKTIDFELIVNSNESYFKQIPSLNLNDRISKTARNLVGLSSFYQKESQTIKVSNLSGEVFNVLLNKKKEWKTTNETKTINGYLCFKATQDKTIGSKKTNIEVIAWYCPKIPFHSGPKEFGGLPGLILELQDGRFTYLANKIDLNISNKIILSKITGKIITEDEYNKICEDSVEKMFNSMAKD